MARELFYRIWAFEWNESFRDIPPDGGFEFFLSEFSVDDIQMVASRCIFKLSAFSGLVVFDKKSDDPILGILRHPTDGDFFIGLTIEDGDDELFFSIAEEWFSGNEEKRQELIRYPTLKREDSKGTA